MPVDFNTIVQNLAKKRVQDRIRAFKNEINTALTNLYGGTPSSTWNNLQGKEALGILLSTTPDVWASEIWAREEGRVAQMLRAEMSIMEEAINAIPDVTGPQP